MTGTEMARGREVWGSRVGFILAAAGSAIGLGNIWRFTYVMGNNGGAAFILIYLVCVALIGIPLFLAELTVGRKTQLNPVGAFRVLRPGSAWPLVGAMGVLAGFLILSYYAVVAGWVLAYAVESPLGTISGLSTPAEAQAHFGALTGSALKSLGYHGLFMLLTILIVVRGIKGGIERASKIMMPAFFLLLLVLIARGLLLPGSGAGVEFLLRPDLSKISPSVFLEALGQAFFTLSLGMGAMITYGSYLSRESNLPRSSVEVAGMDTLVAVAAGFAIFPALFAFGMQPEQGPGLIFVTLPVVFHQMPAGAVFATIFFALVLVAALTSAISLLEVCATYFIDERGWSRSRAAWVLGGITFVLGIPAALAKGPWADWSVASLLGATSGEGLLGSIGTLQLNWFDLVGTITSNYMLPLGGLLTALFVGWVWDRREVGREVRAGRRSFKLAQTWINLLRFVAPLVIAEVLLLGLLAEFPAQHYPGVARLVERLQVAFTWLDIVVAIVVVGASLARMRPDTPESPAAE
jgi:NSS family neurotransmitter:Na+ symporter